MWKVYRNKHYTGIIVSNYEYELKYWNSKSKQGEVYSLVFYNLDEVYHG